MGAVASEGRAHFDKLFSFLNTVSSPLRKDLMKRAGRDASEQTKSPKQARATRHRPQDGEANGAEQLIKAEPSAREIAAAKAARERLYGSGGQADAAPAELRLPTGEAPAPTVEVEHVPTEALQPLDDAAGEMQAALGELQSSDWALACKGLLTLRRLAVHHPEECRPLLQQVVPLVLKGVKSLRSSLSKAAVMAVSDLCSAYGNELLPLLDIGGAAQPARSVLGALLAKGGSNDKRFVIEEVARALATMAECIAPPSLLARLLPYAAHKNPKVRGKVAVSLAASAGRMMPEQWAAYGSAPLLRAAGKLVADNTPEARDAAKRLVALLRDAFEAAGEGAAGTSSDAGQMSDKENEAGERNAARRVPMNAAAGKGGAPQEAEGVNAMEEEPESAHNRWARHCHATLGAVSAATVLKASR